MRVGSLFSGVGGFDMGLEAAGMEIVWQVEYDEQAQTVLRHHWPNVDLHKDVCDVSANQLVPVDLICGGFPCQDLSVAGNRRGLDGERSGLFYEFMRLVGEIAPRWVLIENVPGLLSANGGRDMGAVLGTLGDLGYGYTYRVLDTQYFGPPQRRKRVFIVGCAGGFCPPEVLLEPEGLPWNPAPSREAREGSAGGFAGSPRTGCISGQNLIDFGDKLCALDTGLAHHNRGPIAFDTTQVTSKLNRTKVEPGRECHTLSGDGHPPSVAFTVGNLQRPGTGAEPSKDAFGTLKSRSGDQDPCVTYPAPRRLTPRECERLQGWPDDWTRYGRTPDGETIELADRPRYRMCGNGVSAPVAEWIGRRIMATVENVRESA